MCNWFDTRSKGAKVSSPFHLLLRYLAKLCLVVSSMHAYVAITLNPDPCAAIVILRLVALYGRSFRILALLLPLYILQLLLGGVRPLCTHMKTGKLHNIWFAVGC